MYFELDKTTTLFMLSVGLVLDKVINKLEDDEVCKL